jgi:hypothetical protein
MKKRMLIRSKKLREEIKISGREDVRRDFFELLKRAARTTDFRS